VLPNQGKRAGDRAIARLPPIPVYNICRRRTTAWPFSSRQSPISFQRCPVSQPRCLPFVFLLKISGGMPEPTSQIDVNRLNEKNSKSKFRFEREGGSKPHEVSLKSETNHQWIIPPSPMAPPEKSINNKKKKNRSAQPRRTSVPVFSFCFLLQPVMGPKCRGVHKWQAPQIHGMISFPLRLVSDQVLGRTIVMPGPRPRTLCEAPCRTGRANSPRKPIQNP